MFKLGDIVYNNKKDLKGIVLSHNGTNIHMIITKDSTKTLLRKEDNVVVMSDGFVSIHC